MRASLAASQFGSRLNLLTATDQRLEILRTQDFDRNALVESEHQLASTIANRDAFVQQWSGQVSQELVTARNALDAARQQLARAAKHQELVRLEAPDDAVVLIGQAVGGFGSERGRPVYHARSVAFAGRGRGTHLRA
jgi:hemolysin D